MARVEVAFVGGALADRLARLRRATSDLRPTLAAVGLKLISNTERRFDAETAPDGARWPGLAPAYAARKRGSGILTETGMLRGTLSSEVTGPDEVTVGASTPYAAVHQFGATIRPKAAGGRLVFRGSDGAVWGSAEEVTIPARPYLGFSDADREDVLDALDAMLGAALSGPS